MLNTAVPASGGYRMRSTRIEIMEAYDRLPPIVRKVIREAAFSHNPVSAEILLERYGVSAEDLARFIREDDVEHMKKTRRVWEYEADQ